MDVINLSIGTPDFQPGKHVMEAVSRAALDPDMYKYSLNETRELLDAVENWVQSAAMTSRLPTTDHGCVRLAGGHCHTLVLPSPVRTT